MSDQDTDAPSPKPNMVFRIKYFPRDSQSQSNKFSGVQQILGTANSSVNEVKEVASSPEEEPRFFAAPQKAATMDFHQSGNKVRLM